MKGERLMGSRRAAWSALFFLLALLAGALMLLTGFVQNPPPALTQPAPMKTRAAQFLSTAESDANSALDRHHFFIQLYGGVQRILGRTAVDDAQSTYTVYKLSDGTLTFVNDSPDNVSGQAQAAVDLSQALSQREIPFLYVQAPQKLQENDPRLPVGVYDFGNDNADRFLSVLNGAGVSTLDLRETFRHTGQDWSSFFFRTDHHWTPGAAFTAHRAIAELLSRDYGFSIPAENVAVSSFTRTTYPNWFLGSQGKRVGTLYAGTDNMEQWTPNFPTDFTYSVPDYDSTRSGSFGESLLFPERLEKKDYFNGNPYTLYAGGDYPLATILNHKNPQGKRVVLLRDSYSCALTPFLALNCGELITVDLRSFQGSVLDTIEQLSPDLVIAMYTPGATANDTFFHFFGDSAD